MKSTLVTILAVQAVKEGARVALLDWEPQGSLALWWVMRQKPANPLLISDAEDPVEAVYAGSPDGAWATLPPIWAHLNIVFPSPSIWVSFSQFSVRCGGVHVVSVENPTSALR
jgi:hypothetical protein